MKDYRTWWRKKYDSIPIKYLWGADDLVMELTRWDICKNKPNDQDCKLEQLWAEREGLHETRSGDQFMKLEDQD